MGGFDWQAVQARADALLARYGQEATIRRTTTTGGDPWDPSSGTTTTTDYPCTAVVTSYRTEEVDGTLVQASDRRVTVSTDGLTIEPTTADALVIGSRAFAIMNVEALAPGGTVVAWVLQARA